MIVYVESNFVLELAFQQEEFQYCQKILELAEKGSVALVLPAYSIGEPYEKLVRRDIQRKTVKRNVESELSELRRSASHSVKADQLSDLTRLFVEVGEHEYSNLNATLERLLNVATLVPIDRDILRGAILAQARLDMAPQDSIVYESIRLRAQADPGTKCFLNKNSRDFLVPEIVKEFERHDCKLLPKFGSGLAYITSQNSDTQKRKRLT